MFTGSEIDRMVGVDLTAKRMHSIPAMDETEEEPELVDQVLVRLRQRPLISRGLLTMLILASIVALWAIDLPAGHPAGPLPGLRSPRPLRSRSSPSRPADPGGGTPAGPAAVLTASPRRRGAGDLAPAGAMDKSGLLPPGVGGSISGTIRATSDSQPVGRILVEAQRKTRQAGLADHQLGGQPERRHLRASPACSPRRTG